MRKALSVVAVSILLAGCSGDSGESGAVRATATVAPQTTAADQPNDETVDPPSPLAEVRNRLEKAGFTVRKGDRQSRPRPVDALEVKLGKAQVRILLFDRESQLARVEMQLLDVERDMPDQIEVATSGRMLFIGTIEEPATIPTAAFDEIVDTAGSA